MSMARAAGISLAVLAAVAIGGLVIVPLWKLGRFFEAPGRWDQVKKLRLVGSLGLLAAILAFVVWVPLIAMRSQHYYWPGLSYISYETCNIFFRY